MAHSESDSTVIGRTVFLATVVGALVFALCAYLLVS
jgi:hypothetical protein